MKIIDLLKHKEKKRWHEICDEFEQKIDEEAQRDLAPIEQKGYKNLKRFVKNLREKESKE